MIRNELGRLEMYPRPQVTKAKLFIIGEYPNVDELKAGQYFISTGADSLRQTLTKCHIDVEQCCFSVAVPYLMSKKNKVIPVSRYNLERERLISEIKESGALVVMPLGTLATSLLLNNKTLKITKVLGNVLDIPELPGVKILPNYHPALLLHSPGFYKVFSNVIEMATKLYNGKDVDPGVTQFKTLQTLDEINELIEQVAKLSYVGADIETSGLVTWNVDIWTFGIAVSKNKVSVLTHEIIQQYPEKIRELFSCGTRWIWHNGKFDTSVWWWHDFTEAWLDEDTILLHYCLNETNGSHGLGILATIYLGADEYKSQMNSQFKVITDLTAYYKFKDQLIERVAIDADYTLQLYEYLNELVDENPLLHKLYHEILVPASNFLREVEMNGMKVNVAHLESLVPVYEQKLTDMVQEIQEAAAPFWDLDDYKAQTGAKSGKDVFLPSSPKQLGWLLYDKLKIKPKNKKAKKRSTDVDVLESIDNPPRFIMRILELRSLRKEYSTYVMSYLNMRDSKDMIHSTFQLHITATGRLSSIEPNIQNVPSGRSTLRRSFIPRDKNRILMEVDYSGAELRVLAYISGDKNLAKALTIGDPHGELAESVYHERYTDADPTTRKLLRGYAKTVNFGIAFGRQAKSLSEKLEVSIEEAQLMITTWSEIYPEAWKYLQSCETDARSGKALTTLYGRHRRFGLIHQANIQDLINEAKNFRVQSISSDNTLLAAIKMKPIIRDKYDALIINLIHDSILIDLPSDPIIVNAVAKYAVQTMINLPKELYNCDVPFKSDVDVGANWCDLAAYDIETGNVDYKDTEYSYEEWITSQGVILNRRKENIC